MIKLLVFIEKINYLNIMKLQEKEKLHHRNKFQEPYYNSN